MKYRPYLSAIVAFATLLLVALSPKTAHAAPIAACGGIDFSGATGLTCTFETSAGCMADCTPVNCTATVTAMCQGSASATCTGGCTGMCMGSCSGTPGSFSCSGDCSARCGASCSGQCSSSADTTTCEGQCKASCSNECNINCNGTPPMASCMAECQASCNGSCNVQANFMCESTATASCTGGCMGSCSQPQGALFCDFGNGIGRQYIDITVDQLPDCESALASMFNVNVSGGIDCNGGTCNIGAAASGCALSGNPSAPIGTGALFAGLGLVLATMVRRRKA